MTATAILDSADGSAIDLQRAVAIAALGTLVVTNLVGVWLAALLVWPRLGAIAGPLTYGRWMPLHLDLQLYGWCSLPVIGLLLARFLPVTPRAVIAANLVLAGWCGALAAGALAWLGGHTSGKIFLDWSGPAGLAFTGAQFFLWGVLATGWLSRLREPARLPEVAVSSPTADASDSRQLLDNNQPAPLAARSSELLVDATRRVDTPAGALAAGGVGANSPGVARTGGVRQAEGPAGAADAGRTPRGAGWTRWADAVLLLLLLGVPVALHLAAAPGVYPPINPRSGGATGHSLLASSLGIVAIAIALPALLNRAASRPWRRALIVVLAGFAANWALYLALEHGNASNHETNQIIGLASMLAWPVGLVWWFRHFAWEPSHRLWLIAAGAWSALLVIDGVAVFLPGVLERVKFTNVLVAHSHLAMAGVLTSLNLLMLVSLAPRSRLAAALSSRSTGWAWNGACLAMIALLTWLGWHEGDAARLVADDGPGVMTTYVVRLAAGGVMLMVSVSWLGSALRTDPRLES